MAGRDEMAAAFSVDPKEIVKYLQVLEQRREIRRLRLEKDSEEYYCSAEE
jgi:hypothetical protein